MFCAGLFSVLCVVSLSVGLADASLQVLLDSYPELKQLAGNCIHLDAATDLRLHSDAQHFTFVRCWFTRMSALPSLAFHFLTTLF